MNKMDKPYSICFAIFVLIIALSFKGLELGEESGRSLASTPSSRSISCKSSINRILTKNNSWLKFAPDLGEEGEEIDIELLMKYRKYFSKRKAIEVQPNKDPESLFAWLEEFAMVDKSSVTALSTSELNQLYKYTQDFLNARFRNEDINDYLSVFYKRLMPKEVKSLDIFANEKRLRELMALRVSKEFAEKGLNQFSKEYGLLSDPSRLSRILNSKAVKRLGALVLNIPVIYGMPPLYLPGLKSLEIPDKYASKMLKEGLDFELYKKALKSMNMTDKKFFIGHAARVRYNAFKSQYNRGAGVLLSIIAIQYYYFEQAVVTEEADTLDEATNVLNDKIETASENLSVVEAMTLELDLMTSRQCRSLKRCLKFSIDSSGDIPAPGSEAYIACKEFRDPDNLCQDI